MHRRGLPANEFVQGGTEDIPLRSSGARKEHAHLAPTLQSEGLRNLHLHRCYGREERRSTVLRRRTLQRLVARPRVCHGSADRANERCLLGRPHRLRCALRPSRPLLRWKLRRQPRSRRHGIWTLAWWNAAHIAGRRIAWDHRGVNRAGTGTGTAGGTRGNDRQLGARGYCLRGRSRRFGKNRCVAKPGANLGAHRNARRRQRRPLRCVRNAPAASKRPPGRRFCHAGTHQRSRPHAQRASPGGTDFLCRAHRGHTGGPGPRGVLQAGAHRVQSPEDRDPNR